MSETSQDKKRRSQLWGTAKELLKDINSSEPAPMRAPGPIEQARRQPQARAIPEAVGPSLKARRVLFGVQARAEGWARTPYADGVASPDFPADLLALCRPEAILSEQWRSFTAAEGADAPGGFFIRPARAEGRVYVLASHLKVQTSPSGLPAWIAKTVALEAEEYASNAPDFLWALPEIVANIERQSAAAPLQAPGKLQINSDTAADASRLAAAIAQNVRRPQISAADMPSAPEEHPETAFWRACATLLRTLPETLRPLFSACAGVAGTEAAITLAEAAPDAPPPGASEGMLGKLSAALQEYSPCAWRDAVDATLQFQDAIFDASGAAPDAELQAFLFSREAPPPAQPQGPQERGVFLRRLTAGVAGGAVFGKRLEDFGRVRAAGLLAVQTDAAAEGGWENLEQNAPARTFWKALLLREPAWPMKDPIPSFAALSEILRVDAALREALGPGAATPADTAAFKNRLAKFAARGAILLTYAPDSLLEHGAPAHWAHARPDLFKLAPQQVQKAVLAVLTAIIHAAELKGGAQTLRAEAKTLRDVTATGAHYQAPELLSPATAEDFASRWRAAAAQRAPAAGFWASALKLWFDAALNYEADAAVSAAAALRWRPAPSGGQEHIESLMREALEHVETSGVEAALSTARKNLPPSRAEEAASTHEAAARAALELWLKSWRAAQVTLAHPTDAAGVAALSAAPWREGPAVTALREALGALASAAPAQARALIDEFGRSMLEAANTLATLESMRAGPAETGQRAALWHFAADCLAVWSVAGAAARAEARAFIAALDKILSAASTQMRHAPSMDAALDKLVETLCAWSVGPHPAPYWRGPGVDAPSAETAPDGLLRRASARCGAGFAPYLGLPELTEKSSTPPREPRAWAAALSRLGDTAHRALAFNAVAAWRAHFTEAIQDRINGARAQNIDLSDTPQSVADALAVAAIGRAVTTMDDAEALIGEDVAWAARQIFGLSQDARSRPSHSPAPAAIRKVWKDIAYSETDRDLEHASEFFLFLFSKLAKRTDISAHAPAAWARAPFLEPEAENAPTPAMMRSYLYLERTSERADALELLENAAIEARLDRAFLFICCARCAAPAVQDGPGRWLWDAAAVSGNVRDRLQPPKAFTTRLKRFFAETPQYRQLASRLLDRNEMYLADQWQELRRAIYSRK